MNIKTDIAELSGVKAPLHLAIGVFDGLHLGHQAVIGQSLDACKTHGGQAVVVTFDPHPVAILSPQNAPRLLTSTHHKARLLKTEMGIGRLLAVPFDREFSELSGDAFIRKLCSVCEVGSVSVGRDFQFGKDRSGNVKLLKALGEELDFQVHAAELVEIDGCVASSTKIRESIEIGDFTTAKALLGRNYTVLGTVIVGRQLGRKIGFPTANLTVHSEQLPPTGVYAVKANGVGDSWNGVANLGYRPTVEGGDVKRLLEVHLFGLDDEIYGQDLEVEFVSFLRGELKFATFDELKAQIATDAAKARQILGEA